MKYSDYTTLLSSARMSKYIRACKGDKRMFAVINMFEIILRNTIDRHYRAYFADPDWLLNQAAPGKMLSESASDIIAKANGFKSDGRYSPDRMVSSFMMGFWTYMFTRRHYNAGGKTLLQIFPNRAKGTTQKLVYSELGEIRELRNRIAHHEPICFDSNGNVSTAFASKHYSLILKYMTAMGLDVKSVLYRIESPKAIIAKINKAF